MSPTVKKWAVTALIVLGAVFVVRFVAQKNAKLAELLTKTVPVVGTWLAGG